MSGFVIDQLIEKGDANQDSDNKGIGDQVPGPDSVGDAPHGNGDVDGVHNDGDDDDGQVRNPGDGDQDRNNEERIGLDGRCSAILG